MGYENLIVIKEKDILSNLLKNNNIPYFCIQKDENIRRKNSYISILFHASISLIKRNIKLLMVVLAKRPDILIGSETSITHIGSLLRIPSIVTNEDDWQLQKEFVYPTFPFASVILAPAVCNVGRWERKRIAYDGFQKLSYLHPKYFNADPNIQKKLYSDNRSYILIRLVSLTAHHDVGKRGLSVKLLDSILNELNGKFRIYLSAEGHLDQRLEKYKLELPTDKIHDALSFSRLLISDSQSMSVEASILGVPSIRISDFAGKISVLNELEEKYKLTYGISPNNEYTVLSTLRRILFEESPEVYRLRATKMLADKIDVTAFFVWFIENYPESFKIMKKNPDYQYKFR